MVQPQSITYPEKLNIALVHDWLNQVGGAEDVLIELHNMFPDAPIYTSIYDRARMPAAWRSWDIRPLWMDRLPGIYRYHQPYLPLYPAAFSNLDLSGYDLVLSNKSGFCHGVHTGNTPHVCYCLAPTRYVWQFDNYMQREGVRGLLRSLIRPVTNALKKWDYDAAQRVDRMIAISSDIQARISTFYRRESTVVYPPVATERFKPTPDPIGDYFLIVSRLIPYKRIDLAVQACTRLGLPLLIAGSGRDRERLQGMAGSTVRFLGYVPDTDLPDLIARCQAFLFPGLEDFGIAPVQAQACGRPVIAYHGGGALDTVIPGVTGEFFGDQTVESLIEVLSSFDPGHYDPAVIRNHALQFDSTVFRARMRQIVREHIAAP